VEAAVSTENRIPRNFRNVAVAGAIAIVFVTASSALAFANGAFGSPKVDRVGSFAAIEAQLTPTTTTKPAPSTSTSLLRPGVGTTVHPASNTGPEPTLGSTGEGDHTSDPVAAPGTTVFVPRVDSVPEPTDAPTVAPTTSKPVPRVVSSTVPRTHEVDHEPPEIPGTDD
jgi:hypothetical protein